MTDYSEPNYNRPIRQLDRVLINKIAAGEVVERPASVIKELVENSFDAGATQVDIAARKAGTTYISVRDNGCGIKSSDLKLAFSRHATSKIENLDDLFAVMSYGFRGEALPSIASVSHLTLTTRHYSESEGRCIIIEGGKEIKNQPVAAPIGTTVEVTHLFFNTPARRKFLKAETTESRHIIRVAERMALSKPSCAVSLNLNERRNFNLLPDQPVNARMAALFGVNANSVVEYDVELSGVSYLVYLAHPDEARQDRSRVCLFINGRSVTSSTVIHAVTAGYGEFLPRGKYPLAAIYITVDPNHLDVNVHPTKAEVRLSEERAIHDNLYRIVNKALRDWKLIPSQRAESGAASYRSESGASPEPKPDMFRPSPSGKTVFYPGQNRPAIMPVGHESKFMSSGSSTEVMACDNTKPVIESTPPPEAVTPSGSTVADDIAYLGKAGSQYLIITIGGELYVVDQHAAHERILYETALKQVEAGSATSQKLLFPETIELSGEEYLAFEESQGILNKLGFDVGDFGKNAIVINGMPPVFRDKNPERLIRKLLDDIGQLNKAGGELIKSVAQSLACRAAVMAGDRLNSEEVKSLMTNLLAVNNPYCCPHGRPTFIKISQEELDRRFGRI